MKISSKTQEWNVLVIASFAIAVVVFGMLRYWMTSAKMNSGVPPINEGVACTMEAKICPDGSAVGRQGPNCEFSPCPGEE